MNGDVKVPDRESAARLGRYMIRCPVVLERMSLDEDTGEVIYRTRPSRADHPEGPVARWDVYELIARVLDHLPAPNQQMTRYWGLLLQRGAGQAACRRPPPRRRSRCRRGNLGDAGVTAVPIGTDEEPNERRFEPSMSIAQIW